ncbi:hypothetical protein BJ741DRAFT_261988 [Chytriomyces cf. hyalinus JEL632]|nr:hypothetical protein BJ741DRAFT_261988 [Chytriomyces cf. hyalinus JEL632]
MSFIPRPKIVHSSPLTPSTNAASACTSRPSLKERLHEPITPNSIILPESLDTPTTGNLTQGSLSSATTRFTPTSIQDADQIIADFLNINGHSNTASNQQLGFRPASRPNSQTAPRNSGTRAPGSRPGRILRSTTNSTGTARTQREPTSTAEVPNPSSSLLSRRMNQNSVDGLLSRLQQSSLDEYDAGLVAPLPVPYPRYSISLDTSLGSEADAVEEEEDGEEWYRHVFGDFRDAGIDDRMTRFAGLDDETPVQRLLRRYNEGAEGVDSDMLRRFVTTEADELGDAPNGHGSDGRFSEARSRTLNPLSNTSGVFGGGTNESLTQILLRLSDASAALTNGFNFEVDTSDEEYLSEGERVASLAMLESLIEMGDNGLRSTISAVGATDTEMNKIPVRILGSLVSKSGSGMDVSCCPICLVDFEMGGTVLEYPGCEHCFHRECLFKWLNVSRKCPSCRRELSV